MLQEEARLDKKNPVDEFLDMLIAGETENGESVLEGQLLWRGRWARRAQAAAHQRQCAHSLNYLQLTSLLGEACK